MKATLRTANLPVISDGRLMRELQLPKLGRAYETMRTLDVVELHDDVISPSPHKGPAERAAKKSIPSTLFH
jgi:hypothetical protein